MKLTANFNLNEFRSKDGAEFPDNAIKNIKELAENLQELRNTIGKPITINSGYRSPSHNVAINGAKNSYHLKGMAADIVVVGMTPKQVQRAIKQLIELGKMKRGGLKAYATFVHYDIRGYNANW